MHVRVCVCVRVSACVKVKVKVVFFIKRSIQSVGPLKALYTGCLVKRGATPRIERRMQNGYSVRKHTCHLTHRCADYFLVIVDNQ